MLPQAHALPAAVAVLLLFFTSPPVAAARALQEWEDCATFEGFADLENTRLSCAAAQVVPPAASGVENFTLAWALAQYSGPDFLRLGLQLTDASWAAVAFPRYAYAGELPPLKDATALVFSRPAAVAAADGPDAGAPGVGAARQAAAGLTVAQFSLPEESWSAAQPSTRLAFSTVASGVAPGGGAYAVVEIPSYQLQVPSYGTHYPVRFMPAQVALGGAAAPGAGGGGGSSGGGTTGPWSSPPAATGSLVIPYCCGDLEDVTWRESPSSAASRRSMLAMHTGWVVLATLLALAPL